MHIFDVIALLIFLSGMFIFINTFYLKLPSSLGLMILTLVLSVGIVLTGKLFPDFNIAGHIKAFNFREVLNQLVISIILFAGALNMNLYKLGKQKIPVIVMSLLGTVISTVVIGSLIYFVLNGLSIEISYIYSLIFGAIISSTDPISSSNTTRRFSIPRQLQLKIEGESLFNGAFSVVIAFILYHISLSNGGEISFIGVTKIVSVEILGGIAIGSFFGYIGYKLLQYINNDDAHIEVLLTIALVMVGSFVSGYFNIYSKLVAVMMGLMIGNLGRSKAADSSEDSVGPYVYKFWNLLEETMAVMLFVLMGLEMLLLNWKMEFFAAGFIAVNIVLFGRWLSIYIPVKLMSSKHYFHENTIPVITWGAFRGGLPIALILAFNDFAGKELLITMTYVVVVCSILFQGFTLPLLMKERFRLQR